MEDGDFIETYIHADGGVTNAADTAIILQSSTAPITITFNCTGTTLMFNCVLLGEEYLQQLKDLEMWDELEVYAEEFGMPEFYLD